jgi:hypothetical protein
MVLLLSHFPESLRRCAFAIRRVCFSVNPVAFFLGELHRRVAVAFRGGRPFFPFRPHRPAENARATCAVPRPKPVCVGTRFAVAGRINRNVISRSSEWKRTAAPAANTVAITSVANCIIPIMACLPVVHCGHGTATTKTQRIEK